jgi:hypothetical protein
MFFVKAILIAAFLICGAFFLAMGLVRDAPIGLVFVIAGIALARCWPVSQDSSYKNATVTGPGRVVEERKKSYRFIKPS